MPYAPTERYDFSPLVRGAAMFGAGVGDAIAGSREREQEEEKRLRSEAQKFQGLVTYLSKKTGKSKDFFTPMSIGELEGYGRSLVEAEQQQDREMRNAESLARIAATQENINRTRQEAEQQQAEYKALEQFNTDKPFNEAPLMMQGVPGAKNAVTGERYDNKRKLDAAGLAGYVQENPLFAKSDAYKGLSDYVEKNQQGEVSTVPVPGTNYVIPKQGNKLVGGPLPVPQPDIPGNPSLEQVTDVFGNPIPGLFRDPRDGKIKSAWAPDPEMGGRIPYVPPNKGKQGTSQSEYATAEEVAAAYKAGKLTREAAKKILLEKFNIK